MFQVLEMKDSGVAVYTSEIVGESSPCLDRAFCTQILVYEFKKMLSSFGLFGSWVSLSFAQRTGCARHASSNFGYFLHVFPYLSEFL